MLGAEPMTVPHSGIQYAHPWSWKELGGLFRLAASACVVMPIAAQTTAVIAIIRATVMLSPWLGPPPAGSQVKQAGSMLRKQKLHRTRGPTTLCRSHVRFESYSLISHRTHHSPLYPVSGQVATGKIEFVPMRQGLLQFLDADRRSKTRRGKRRVNKSMILPEGPGAWRRLLLGAASSPRALRQMADHPASAAHRCARVASG